MTISHRLKPGCDQDGLECKSSAMEDAKGDPGLPVRRSDVRAIGKELKFDSVTEDPNRFNLWHRKRQVVGSGSH